MAGLGGFSLTQAMSGAEAFQDFTNYTDKMQTAMDQGKANLESTQLANKQAKEQADTTAKLKAQFEGLDLSPGETAQSAAEASKQQIGVLSKMIQAIGKTDPLGAIKMQENLVAAQQKAAQLEERSDEHNEEKLDLISSMFTKDGEVVKTQEDFDAAMKNFQNASKLAGLSVDTDALSKALTLDSLPGFMERMPSHRNAIIAKKLAEKTAKDEADAKEKARFHDIEKAHWEREAADKATKATDKADKTSYDRVSKENDGFRKDLSNVRAEIALNENSTLKPTKERKEKLSNLEKDAARIERDISSNESKLKEMRKEQGVKEPVYTPDNRPAGGFSPEQPATLSSQEDFNKLEPGDYFINPADGKMLRKKAK